MGTVSSAAVCSGGSPEARREAGPYDLHGYGLASRNVQVDLHTGAVRSLSDGPTVGGPAGGPTQARRGLKTGRRLYCRVSLLHRTLMAPPPLRRDHECEYRYSFCVEPLEGPNASGSYENSRAVTGVRFADAGGQRLVVSHYAGGVPQGNTEYRRTAADAWVVSRQTSGDDRAASGGLEVTVRQGLNDPPVLLASDSKTQVSRAIWDPNPQLKNLALGEAKVYQWKDKAGRAWKGGLFKPVPYESGRRYPLVIQTHGFSETEFRPSGLFPTAFAARALAGAGLVVLQVQDCPIEGTPEEGPCNVGGL